MKARGQMPDVIVPPHPPVPPVPLPDPPERDDPAAPGDWPDWSDDELPPVVNSVDEDVPWAAFHLWRDDNGKLHMSIYEGDRVIQVVPEAEEHARPLGWYDFDWKPSRDPCEVSLSDVEVDPPRGFGRD